MCMYKFVTIYQLEAYQMEMTSRIINLLDADFLSLYDAILKFDAPTEDCAPKSEYDIDLLCNMLKSVIFDRFCPAISWEMWSAKFDGFFQTAGNREIFSDIDTSCQSDDELLDYDALCFYFSVFIETIFQCIGTHDRLIEMKKLADCITKACRQIQEDDTGRRINLEPVLLPSVNYIAKLLYQFAVNDPNADVSGVTEALRCRSTLCAFCKSLNVLILALLSTYHDALSYFSLSFFYSLLREALEMFMELNATPAPPLHKALQKRLCEDAHDNILLLLNEA